MKKQDKEISKIKEVIKRVDEVEAELDGIKCCKKCQASVDRILDLQEEYRKLSIKFNRLIKVRGF